VGPESSGKTTLLQHLGTKLHPNAVVLHCRGPKADACAVLTSLLLSADLAPWDLSEVEQRNLLTVFVHQRRLQNRGVLVLIDDAHSFEPAAVEELERLAAFKINKQPALELLLAGPASVANHWLDARERVGTGEVLVHPIAAPSQGELVHYLEWRLARFDLQNVATAVALQALARFSAGRYEAADVLCQMSLLLHRQLGSPRLEARIVRQAVAKLTPRQEAKLEAAAQQEMAHDAEKPPQGHVVLSRGGKTLARVALGPRTLIGRSEQNDVCLPSPYLSRHHAAIIGTPEGYYVLDLDSINGVLLNGKPIERSVLCNEDVLSIGAFRLKLQLPETTAQVSSAPSKASISDTVVEPSISDTAVLFPQIHESAVWNAK
jgi:pSer/pThr/pTyr-binding forkhead associated (FHA) protein